MKKQKERYQSLSAMDNFNFELSIALDKLGEEYYPLILNFVRELQEIEQRKWNQEGRKNELLKVFDGLDPGKYELAVDFAKDLKNSKMVGGVS
jgi:hypothetical protein